MAFYATLELNGEDISPISEWDATWEERIDGVGTAQVTIQDRLMNGPEYGKSRAITDPISGHTTIGWRDILKISTPSTNLFWGEVVTSKLALPTGFPWRRWSISATDMNSVPDSRLVGAPTGLVWETIDGGQTHTPIDPDARGLSRDGPTLQALFENYVMLPNGVDEELDTTTYVHNWIPRSVMMDGSESRLRWTNTTLRAAIDEMRGLAGFPIFMWIDPDLAVHWEAFADWSIPPGSGLPMLRPLTPYQRSAPAVLVDENPNHSTSVGFRDLSIQYDANFMPQDTYLVGITDFIYNGGSTIFQGTGWDSGGSHNKQHPGFRQVSVDAQAVTAAQRSAVSMATINYSRRARIRGTVTVGSPEDDVDGWRVGQLLRIFDARLPAALYGARFPIQRVSGSLKAGNEFRVYTLEFGDMPIARFSQKYRATPQRIGTARLAAKRHRINWPTRHLRPSTAYTLYSQMVDHSDKPVRHGGVPVGWSLRVTNGAGASVSAGSIVALGSATDSHGRTAATLTTGATTDLHYHVSARTGAQ